MYYWVTNASTAVNHGLVQKVWYKIISCTLIQRSKIVVIWMETPLFTSPFFMESYCLYPFWDSSCSKIYVLVVKNYMGFVAYTHRTHRMKPSQNKRKRKFVYLNLVRSLARAVTHDVTNLSSNGGGT